MHLLRRAAVVLSLLALCAAPAVARRAGTSAQDDAASRTQPHAPATEALSQQPAHVAHPVTPVTDETPVCMTPPTRTAAGARTDILRSNAPEAPRTPATPDPAADRREKAKPTPSISPRSTRTHAPRARVTTRPMPATPGMGTLLRMGITVGPEISFLDEWTPEPSARSHSGRAPPAGSTHATFALASPAAPQRLAEPLLPGSATHLSSEQPGRSSRTDARDACALECPGMPRLARSASVVVEALGGTTT